MKANSSCKGAQYVDVYFNGVKLERCFEADEEEGVAYIAVEDADGSLISEHCSPYRALVCEGVMVAPVRGKIEIRVTPPEGESVESMREQMEKTYTEVVKVRV